MKKFVNGQYIELTAEEIAEHEALRSEMEKKNAAGSPRLRNALQPSKLPCSLCWEVPVMYEFIRIQYRMGKLTAEQVMNYAPKWITAEQAERIVAENVI